MLSETNAPEHRVQASLKRCGLKFSSRYDMSAKFPGGGGGGGRPFFSSKSIMLFWTPILEYLKIRPLPNSKLSPISLSQRVSARKKTDTNLGQMYNRNCNLSPMMPVGAVDVLRSVDARL